MPDLMDLWKTLHLIGLCLAIGSVFIADHKVLKHLQRPAYQLKTKLPILNTLHHTISLGFILLILSGIAIVYSRFDSLTAIPDKVWWKSILVSLLLINSVFINHKIMPLFEQIAQSTNKTSLLIHKINSNLRLKIAISSSISSLGWGGSFLLGSIKMFETMSFVEIAPYILMFWLIIFFFTLAIIDFYAQSQASNKESTKHNLIQSFSAKSPSA